MLIPDTLEQSFVFVVTMLEAFGLTISNPQNSKVTTWDESGVQIEIAAENVPNAVLTGSILNIQFWKSAGEDMFVAWETVDGGCSFSFFLDGLDSNFSLMLVAKLAESALTRFRSRYDGPALILTFG
ncbi:hypothetical protein AT302_09720 [Pandoraea norimbergensis]|uniref:Uncharacterized protein n=1 Tax=Pandoraea norimbergensis TaxID=93219 RepID=A0ABN4JGM7_9BURK|nr:hypothetical protein AT302_09720 [Pandoraea norimbergensis]